MGYIYKIQNKINNKIYIGKTVNTIQDRWLEHINEANHQDDTLLHKAIHKYGKENFYVDKIEECSCDILNEKEIYYIALFHSHMSEGGYNMTYGGEGTTKYSDKDILDLWAAGLRGYEIAEKLGANPNTISQRLKFLVEDSAARKRYFESRKKSVIQYDIYGEPIKIWDSASNAEISLNIAKGAISKCCNKIASIAGDYLWKFMEDDTPIEELQIRYAESNKCCSVNLIDDKGNVLQTFSSGKEAETIMNLPRGKVSEVCNKKRSHTRGYKFEWGYPIKRRIINEKLK
jgi:hypothetical protein